MSDEKVDGKKPDRPLTLEEHLDLVVGGGMRSSPEEKRARTGGAETSDAAKPKS